MAGRSRTSQARCPTSVAERSVRPRLPPVSSIRVRLPPKKRSCVSVAQITAPGTVVRNAACVAYQFGSGAARTTLSNEVQLAVQPLPSRAAISLARYDAASSSSSSAGPTQCRAASGFFPLASPSPQGRGPLDPAQPIPLQDTRVAHAGDPIFVRVVDPDRNRDGNVVETVDVRVAVAATGD